MTRIVSLGGSNSVLREGLVAGLKRHSEVWELATGASTSLQNLLQVVRFGKEFHNYDYVVTESNVNDIHAHNRSGLSLDQTLGQIEEFYQILASNLCFNHRVVVVILPTSVQPIFNNVDKINSFHIEMARKLGFSYIDMHSSLSPYRGRFSVLDDNLHGKKLLMKILGAAISRIPKEAVEESFSFGEPTKEYLYVAASEIAGSENDLSRKENSRFSEEFVDLKNEYAIGRTYSGFELIGVSTWCDGDSKLKISGNDSEVIKSFSKWLSFNEFRSKILIDEKTLISPFNGDSVQTEASINVLPVKRCEADLHLVGLLLRRKNDSFEYTFQLSSSFSDRNLSHLLPDWIDILAVQDDVIDSALRFKIFKELLDANKDEFAFELIEGYNSDKVTDEIRRVALVIEDQNPVRAVRLIGKALERRPKGEFLQMKYKELVERVGFENLN